MINCFLFFKLFNPTLFSDTYNLLAMPGDRRLVLWRISPRTAAGSFGNYRRLGKFVRPDSFICFVLVVQLTFNVLIWHRRRIRILAGDIGAFRLLK